MAEVVQEQGMFDPKTPKKNLNIFGIMLLVLEVMICVVYGFFVRMKTNLNDPLLDQRYPAFQDVNVMMLVGFGFLMTFIRTNALTALTYTFFINAIIFQLYILMSAFWERVFDTGFEGHRYIYLDQKLLTKASYCVASILIAFGAVLGRVGPKDLLIMGIIQAIGYTLNEEIVAKLIVAFDYGGSMTIHAFGAYFGLTFSIFLSRIIKPVWEPASNYASLIYSMVGTVFLWMFWPSFNFGVFADTPYEQNLVVTNTILSLTGSCLGTYMLSALLKKKFTMEDILNATLAGGVIIGAPCGAIYYPGVSIGIGFVGGVISTWCFHYLDRKLKEWISLYDTCQVHNLHGIPGILGGLFSGMIIAAYNTVDLNNTSSDYHTYTTSPLTSTNNVFLGKESGISFLGQGALQVAGTFCSVGIAIGFGILAGLIFLCTYNENPYKFYLDENYIEFEEHEGVLSTVVPASERALNQ